ncbi:MAG: hypothetical protein ACYCPO_14760, partial [Acidobacteriaceae bacterium]
MKAGSRVCDCVFGLSDTLPRLSVPQVAPLSRFWLKAEMLYTASRVKQALALIARIEEIEFGLNKCTSPQAGKEAQSSMTYERLLPVSTRRRIKMISEVGLLI